MASTKKKDSGWLWLVGGLWDTALASLVYVAVVLLLAYMDRLPAEKLAGWMLSVYIVAAGGVFLLLTAVGLLGWTALVRLQQVRDNSQAVVESFRRLLSSQTSTEAILTQINENLLLSDSIKSVAFREKDRQVIEEAVRQDLRGEQWESAALLMEELEQRFGCRRRVQELRDEMAKLQQATRQEKLDAAIEHVSSLWMIHRYDDALREAGALARLYPDEPRVQKLAAETEDRREAHKQQLLTRLDKLLEANDVDQGVEVLKLLDGFLTPTEAAALQESARGVFRAKLQKLGVQFSLFVSERKWSQALRVGKAIITEFPNSRMAQEVREKLDVLEHRAAREPR